MSNRRNLLLTVALLGLAYMAVGGLPGLFPPDLNFETHPALPDFRTVARGDVSSSGFNPLIGIEGPREAPAGFDPTLQDVRSDPCRALYGDLARQEAVLPIASFSDYYCPFCRVQTVKLGRMESELKGRIKLVWHELPLLGETSQLAARAALAAKRQGAYVRFHEHLMQSNFVATEAYLTDLSEKLGINSAKLLADMDSAEVKAELQRSSALAQLFRFIGTPSMVVGRTVVEGTIPDRDLATLIEDELDRLKPGWCAAG